MGGVFSLPLDGGGGFFPCRSGLLLLVGLLLLFLCFLQSLFVCCENVRVCHERCSPCNLLAGFAYESFCLVVAKGGRVGVELVDVWVRQELPLGAVENAPCVGRDVDQGDMLPSLSSACCGGAEACFDGVVLSG
jgi:hypothetical protein